MPHLGIEMALFRGVMNDKKFLWFASDERARSRKAVVLLSLFSVLMSGCYTPPTQAVYTGPRFREAGQVNVVLQFMRWDSIMITQPEFREDGFLRLYTRDELPPVLASPRVGHDLAVVLIGFTYQDEHLAEVVKDWKVFLNGCGFRRVVCLRAGGDDRIDGLPVIDDTHQPVDASKQNARL